MKVGIVGGGMSHRPGLWRRYLRALWEVERRELQPLRGLRLALGVAIPMVAGIASGHASIGAFASGGALGAGFGAFLGIYRTRAVTMAAASVALSLSLFIGSLAGQSAPLGIGLVMLWSFAAGLLGVFGPPAYFVGLQAVLNMLVGSGFPTDIEGAAVRMLAAFGGGMLQTLLAVGEWPLRRFVTERALLGDVYRTLARYAGGALDASEPPPPLAVARIYAVLADPHPFASHADVYAFQRLLDEAEQIRVSLAAIVPLLALRSVTPADHAIGALPHAAAAVLDEIAQAVQVGRMPAGQEQAWHVLQSVESAARDARVAATRASRLVSVRPVHVSRLLGQLRASWRMASEAPRENERVPATPLPARTPAFAASLQTLRTAWTLRSPALRHALRIVIAVGLAAALAHAMQLSNGYWLPITVLLVLQPAFGDTMTRGLGMMSGTLVGAGAASLAAALLRPEPWTLAALIAISAWLCFTLFRANYAAFAACMTAYVVFLVSFFGLPEPVAALNRVIAIVLGGVLGLAAYALWPTWEAYLVPGRLADALDALARYARVLLARLVTPQTADDHAMAEARRAAQLARSNAEDSVTRMLGEPHASRGLAPATALGVLAAMRSFAGAGLVLDAAQAASPCPPWPALGPLARGIELDLRRLAQAMRSGGPLPPAPALRLLHARLSGRSVDDLPPGSRDSTDCAALRQLAISETDLMVDSVDAIVSLLRANRRPA